VSFFDVSLQQMLARRLEAALTAGVDFEAVVGLQRGFFGGPIRRQFLTAAVLFRQRFFGRNDFLLLSML
jgi:hypothetical protein